jgi:SOS-response transcriptional repressor LexA
MEVWDARVSCGPLKETCEVSDKRKFHRWAMVPRKWIRLEKKLFCLRAAGDSMNDRIRSGQWCILYKYEVGAAGSRYGQIVLYRDTSKAGIERYTLKRYESEIEHLPNGTWRHGRIRLHPLNEAEYDVIELSPSDEQDILGVFVDVVDELVFPEQFHYEPVEYEPFMS